MSDLVVGFITMGVANALMLVVLYTSYKTVAAGYRKIRAFITRPKKINC